MIPAAVFDTLATDPVLNGLGITAATIFERQSCEDNRPPIARNHFVVIDMQDTALTPHINRGPRAMQISVHVDRNQTRDYSVIDRILGRVGALLLPMEQLTGTDDIRVCCIRPTARSGNLTDGRWRTITRNALYSILLDDSAV